MIRSTSYRKGIDCSRMSSFIVTPYRLRRPSRPVQHNASTTSSVPVEPEPEPEPVVHADEFASLQTTVSGLTDTVGSLRDEFKKHTSSSVSSLRNEFKKTTKSEVTRGMNSLRNEFKINTSSELTKTAGSLRDEFKQTISSDISEAVTSLRDEFQTQIQGLTSMITPMKQTISEQSALIDTLTTELHTMTENVNHLIRTGRKKGSKNKRPNPPPVLQKRVSGNGEGDAMNTRFGNIHRVVSQKT